MASVGAHKRLTREYANMSANPPPYIVAHPSEKNILEWHCIVTGPPDTPYDGGQYHVTLVFPHTYPFAPPAIRMLTPSGRFQPNTRLCLSISDFHPKSFNPAWEVSTILLGLQSFMTSDEMTSGSISASDAERRHFASRTRWWNSTGGGTCAARDGEAPNTLRSRFGATFKAGDGGALFREQWPDLDAENWAWIEKNNIDPLTGKIVTPAKHCSHDTAAIAGVAGLATNPSGNALAGVEQAARNAEAGWVGRNKWRIVLVAVVGYVLLARLFGETQ